MEVPMMLATGMYNSASIMVTSDDPDVPIITIESSATTTGVTEGFSFDFTVTSDRMITNNPLEISFEPNLRWNCRKSKSSNNRVQLFLFQLVRILHQEL